MKRGHLNAIVDTVALVGFMGLASSGMILRYQLPPGSGGAVGRGTGRGSMSRSIETLWELTRHEWGDYHYWIALGLLAVLSVHLLLHWKWIVGVVRGKATEASGLRLAIGLFAFAAVIFAAAFPLMTSTETTMRQDFLQQRTEPPLTDFDSDFRFR